MFIAILINMYSDPKTKAFLTMHTKNYEQAKTEWIHALGHDPYNPLLHMNLALNFEYLQNQTAALDGYLSSRDLLPLPVAPALSQQPQNFRLNRKKHPARHLAFDLAFNTALLYSKQQPMALDQALNHYQEALRFNPNSTEVKTNIELLFRQKKKNKQKKQTDKQETKKDQKKQPSQESEKNKEDQNSPPQKNKEKQPAKENNQDQKPAPEKETEKNEPREESEDTQSPSPGSTKEENLENKEETFSNQNQDKKNREKTKLSPELVEALFKEVEEQEKQLERRRKRVKTKSRGPIKKEW